MLKQTMGIEQQPPQHRKIDMAARDLIAHVQFKLDMLPDLATRFNLGEEAVEGLRAHLQSEIDYLSNLPPEATLKDMMENHFTQGAAFRKGVTGKDDNER